MMCVRVYMYLCVCAWTVAIWAQCANVRENVASANRTRAPTIHGLLKRNERVVHRSDTIVDLGRLASAPCRILSVVPNGMYALEAGP